MATQPQSQLEESLVEKRVEQALVWIPERMNPGTIFLLENQTMLGPEDNPYMAVMACPACGTLGLITRHQLFANEFMICGGEVCSKEWRIEHHMDEAIFIFRPTQ